jgi:hypothetical protein
MQQVVGAQWVEFASEQEVQAQVSWFEKPKIFDPYLLNGAIYIVEDAGEILGCAGVKILSDDIAYFGHCYIRNSGQGLGSLLTRKRLEWVGPRGIIYLKQTPRPGGRGSAKSQ